KFNTFPKIHAPCFRLDPIKYEDGGNKSKRYTGQQQYPVEPETSDIGKNAFVYHPDYNQEGTCQ
ncbi:hypothetical protein, partial [Xylanibacter rodentium]|uniref:hypothetical protein n=1 Tax=Xylanibacter rodentium TaxID=2736289 RepID=UPI002595BD0F